MVNNRDIPTLIEAGRSAHSPRIITSILPGSLEITPSVIGYLTAASFFIELALRAGGEPVSGQRIVIDLKGRGCSVQAVDADMHENYRERALRALGDLMTLSS